VVEVEPVVVMSSPQPTIITATEDAAVRSRIPSLFMFVPFLLTVSPW
jgi:hypothetical protein